MSEKMYLHLYLIHLLHYNYKKNTSSKGRGQKKNWEKAVRLTAWVNINLKLNEKRHFYLNQL